MTIPRNLSFLAEGASSTGVLGTANGGTGLSTLGTAGQALVVNSGATGLTYSTPSAGAMTLISTQTASNSAAIAWTGLTGYDKYKLIIENFVPASNTFIRIQIGTGSTTYITSGYYGALAYMISNVGGASLAGSPINNNSSIYFGSYNSIATTGSGGSCVIDITNFTNGSDTAMMFNSISLNSAGVTETDVGSAFVYNNSTTKTAIKIFSASGNILSGTASLYGISS